MNSTLSPTISAIPSPAAEVPRKAMRGIAWSSLQNLANNAISFGSYAVLARLLPPGDFGLLAFAVVFTVFLQMFVEQGIPDAIVQRTHVSSGHLNAAFWFNLAVSSGLMGILWLAAPVVAELMHEPRLANILRWLAPLLIISALSGVQQAILKRALGYKSLALQSLMSTVVGGLVAVVCALRGYGVWSLVAQQLASATFTAILLWTVSSWRPSFEFSLKDLRELTHFSIHVTASAFLDFFNRRSDDFLIGYFLGSTALGYYSLAYRLLLTFTRLITSPFNSVAFSAFSRLQHEPNELRRLFNQFTRLTALAAFPAFLVLAVIAPDLLTVVFGVQWQSATPVLRILCFIGVLHSIAFLHGTVIRASGHAKWQMWFTLAGALTNVIGFAYFVRFGVTYIAAWYVTSAYLWLSLDLRLLKRVLRHETCAYLRGFVGSLLKAITAGGAVLLVQLTWPAHLPIVWKFAVELLTATIVVISTNAQLLRNPSTAFRLAPSPAA